MSPELWKRCAPFEAASLRLGRISLGKMTAQGFAGGVGFNGQRPESGPLIGVLIKECHQRARMAVDGA